MSSIATQALKSVVRVTTGALVAACMVYAWSWLFRQVLPFKFITSVDDKEALIRFVEVEFPQSGTYTLPRPDDDDEIFKELVTVGPVVTLHVLSSNDVYFRTQWWIKLLQIFFTVFVIGWVLWLARPAMDSYRLRVVFVVLMGLAAASYNDLADLVWAYHPWRWSLAKALYHISSWAVAGFILSADVFIGFKMRERKRKSMLAEG